ncbi:hypothetical protein EDB81DRAFT_786294 [Dactylonectria macrodidyma]|uniref:Uncharacterized protein n=1 Tax=Dactylonectria macrodidyma TaxID=307937 RepID=A0A9P9JD64_9HYPO|nr:hypothetical protein EDB81DRAFT_786294 [Dactylonectria macrodidyma]
MHASSILVALSAVASASASAIRLRGVDKPDLAAVKPDVVVAVERDAVAMEKRADQTAAWVTVDDEGQPETTYTPSMTVVDGTTSIEHGAPHDITASVYTITEWGKITTSTGDPPNPTAKAKSGQGAFARCHNMDGDNAPFCEPSSNSTLFVGSTYYITWDPDYFNKTKTNVTYEVSVRIDYLNETSGDMKQLTKLSRVPAAWGFSPLTVESKYLKGFGDHNATLTLYSNIKGSAEKTKSTSIWVQFAKQSLPKNEDTPSVTGDNLTIALPVAFGSIVLLLIGGCLWNRKTRKISMGNIMSRTRHGYTGRKTRRMFGRKDNGIQLDTRAAAPSEYRDAPERPRRDSDALGSLVNSPVDPSFHQQGTTGGRNAFREEMQRQERERR